MSWDIITTFALISSVILIWVQRKAITELERDVWEIEQAYKTQTGTPYRYKHRLFNINGNSNDYTV